VILKRPSELEIMHDAGELLYQVHDLVAREVEPGVTTAHLNGIAERAILKFGARPAFLGYNGYPATINASINEVIVHGIPNSRKLKSGDIISIDIGLKYRGFVADSARTLPVGDVSPLAKQLIEVTDKALWAGIRASKAGGRLGDVSNAVQRVVEAAGMYVVRKFVGHGVGREMHEDPQVPNWGQAGKGPALKPGLVFALEPMVMTTNSAVDTLADGWTEVTRDKCLSAQIEHTVAITENGPRVLTLPRNAAHGPTYEALYQQQTVSAQ
jgi:methionyl aminopeptidase